MSIVELESRELQLEAATGGLWSDAWSRLRRNPAAIGGFVYQGSKIHDLRGKYVFADLTGFLFVADLSSGKIEKLTEFYVWPGFLTENMYLYLATELTEASQNLDEDEILSIKRLTFPQALRHIRQGDIEDAKTIVGLMLTAAKFGFAFETI